MYFSVKALFLCASVVAAVNCYAIDNYGQFVAGEFNENDYNSDGGVLAFYNADDSVNEGYDRRVRREVPVNLGNLWAPKPYNDFVRGEVFATQFGGRRDHGGSITYEKHF